MPFKNRRKIENCCYSYLALNLAQLETKAYRLLVIVTPPGSDIPTIDPARLALHNLVYTNVSLELSAKLMEVEPKRRALESDNMLKCLSGQAQGDGLFLDNLGVLFDPSLALKPLKLLRDLSKYYLLIVAWQGILKDGVLSYAAPDHFEYCREVLDNTFTVVDCSHEV
jgi:hypothetical protein